MGAASSDSGKGALVTEITSTILTALNSNDAVAEQTVLVQVTTASGHVGYGEANAAVEVVKAYLDRDPPRGDGWDEGIQTLLLGQDARNPRALWRLMRANTFWSARAGAGYVALAAVDMALWDLAGKLRGVPVWQLLGESRNQTPRAYVTVYHGRSRFAEAIANALDTVDTALALGYRTVKVEAVAENTDHPDQAIELVQRVRERLPDGVDLLVDFGYRFRTFEEAEHIFRALDVLGLWAFEAPFQPELVDEYRKLRAATSTPIASGDCLTAPTEHYPLLDAGLIDVVQAGASRTGISGMDELARYAGARGRSLVPWGWVTSALSVAANVHLAIAHDNIPIVEYGPPFLHAAGSLRTTLAGPEPQVVDGCFTTPAAPGLGVDIHPEAVSRFEG